MGLAAASVEIRERRLESDLQRQIDEAGHKERQRHDERDRDDGAVPQVAPGSNCRLGVVFVIKEMRGKSSEPYGEDLCRIADRYREYNMM
jgi:hypothetical protein